MSLKNSILSISFSLLVMVSFSSCATIFCGTKGNTTITGNTTDSIRLVIDNKDYGNVTLPYKAKMKRGFSSSKIKAYSYDGVDTVNVEAKKNFNFITLIYPFPGFLAIDAITGAMMKPKKTYNVFFTNYDITPAITWQQIDVDMVNYKKEDRIKKKNLSKLNNLSQLDSIHITGYKSMGKISENYFLLEKESLYFLYNKLTDQTLGGYHSVNLPSDGLCLAKKSINGTTKYVFIKLDSFKELKLTFDHAQDFTEGLAHVSYNGSNCYINILGKIVLKENNQIDFPSEYAGFSEGAALAYNKEIGLFGYIHNPYNKNVNPSQTQISERAIQKWIELGNNASTGKEYYKAIYYYNQAIKYDPENIEALVSLSGSLYYSGNYSKSMDISTKVLQKDPQNKLAEYYLNSAHEKNESRRQQTQKTETDDFLTNLSKVGAMMQEIGNTMNNGSSGISDSQANARGTSSSKCEELRSRYKKLKYMLAQEIGDNSARQASASSKDHVHNEYGAQYNSGATAGDRRVINSSKSTIRTYEQEIKRIEQQAKKIGCTLQ